MHSLIIGEIDHWNNAGIEAQEAAARALLTTKLGTTFRLEGLKAYTSGAQTHRVAVFLHDPTAMRFHLIPGGEYKVGSGEHTSEIERNYKIDLTENAVGRIVRVAPFLISRYLATEYAWARFAGAPLHRNFGPQRAVDVVDRAQVTEWAAKFGARLPTEAEWEYACRAGSTSIFYWGNEPDEAMAWTSLNTQRPIVPRTENEQKPPNAFGLVGMIGNLGEWVEDDAYNFSAENYPGDRPYRRKTGGADGVLRGGWHQYDWGLNRTSSRVACGAADTGCSARVVIGDLLNGQALAAEHPVDVSLFFEGMEEGTRDWLKRERAKVEPSAEEKRRRLVEEAAASPLVSTRRYKIASKPKLFVYGVRPRLFEDFRSFAATDDKSDEMRMGYVNMFWDALADIERDLGLAPTTARAAWQDYLYGTVHERCTLLYVALSDMLCRSFLGDSLKYKGWSQDDKRAVAELAGIRDALPEFSDRVPGIRELALEAENFDKARAAATASLSKNASRDVLEWLQDAESAGRSLRIFLIAE